MSRRLSADAARRIAVAAQGLAAPRPASVDVRHFRKVMRTVKVVQLDSVNVAARTHYMPFYARLGPYDRDKLDRWAANSGELFEYWCHCAAWAPIGDYPLFDFRRDEMQGNWAKSVDEEHPGYIDAVYEEVAANGPMTISDLDDPGG
ncbi:MAG: winged helix DNA-binding domain-containing protein, partial [Acidimicrobiia bacterium]|nr:winged helix DNA-binding domain-containing protein [Acidimicrobiia bacterium]